MIVQQERYHNYILRRSREDREEMNTTTNVYVVHTYDKNNNSSINKFLGVYSSKELADECREKNIVKHGAMVTYIIL